MENLTQKQLRIKFNKVDELVVTGGNIENVWFWRKDELSLKEFYQLSRKQKDEYIEHLLSFDESQLSTNDEYVLKYYAPEQLVVNKKFLSIDEQVYENLPKIIEIERTDGVLSEQEMANITFEEICELGLQHVIEYLDIIFENENPRWHKELTFIDSEKFIEAASSYIEINQLTKLYIEVFKILQK